MPLRWLLLLFRVDALVLLVAVVRLDVAERKERSEGLCHTQKLADSLPIKLTIIEIQ